jgi:hypothetical protein
MLHESLKQNLLSYTIRPTNNGDDLVQKRCDGPQRKRRLLQQK